MSYLGIATMCVIVLIVGVLSLLENELFSKKKKYRFIIIAMIMIVEIIIDTVAISIDGHDYNSNIYKALKICEFILAPVIPAIFARQVAHKAYWGKISKCFTCIIIINAIAQVLTFFVPLMFEVDANGTYTRTVFTYFYVASIVLCVILLIIASRNTYIQSTTTTNLTLVSITLILFVGMIIRALNYKSNADWLTLTFGYLIFIIYYSNSYLKIDPVTSLLNRRAFNSKLSHINYSTAIIIIDANNFKTINDTYGHQCGDLALAKIAEAIFECYSLYGFCYRTGGDEFTVVLKKHMLKRLTYETENFDTYLMVWKFISALNKKIESMVKEYPMLKFGVSQGFGVYHSPSESPTLDKYRSIEDVIRIADERMYKNKEKFKKRKKNIAF